MNQGNYKYQSCVVISLITIIVLSIFLAGCSPAGIIIGTSVAGFTAVQTKNGFYRTIDDRLIYLQLNSKLFQTNYNLFPQVSFSVDRGKVLLTGNVENAKDRIIATRLAWSVDGVVQVINELQVNNRFSIINFTLDTQIGTDLRFRMLADKKIAVINYSIDVVNQIVYIMGIARTQNELNRVIAYAQDIPFVKGVVNYVIVQ
ncbi:putative phospholipid-binding domain protein [Candidatus Endolissoclinum faulkneri L2]|uniref:Putative phospholipid-binding domain protein n=1 Tax=Candidatus Endolissoclinum faulkneri L2 TaxID=1193729 RepID=K7ZCU8_9PROT|nr:BON domain-containing protein [Candidatus Endolissoclinum faulkneri]AFX98916.1 putative phospholipid-binding domain protein [Candidatus Endolissoclinum faulkneri L2]